MAYFGKATKAKEENNKQTAIEIMNLKITNVQMQSYQEEGKMPNLQYLADKLWEDNEIQYIANESQKQDTQKTKEKITVTGKSIFTKIEEYPYEFEINDSFQVVINGELISIQSGYMKIPTETKTILENGEEIDVLNYAKVNVNVSLPEGFVKPIGTKNIIANGEYDILNYAKVNVNVPETTGKGKYWDNGYFDIKEYNIHYINLGFNPSYICFTNRTNGSGIIYNSKISTDKQYINGVEFPINREDGSTIVSVGSTIVFRSNYNLTWDWIALP